MQASHARDCLLFRTQYQLEALQAHTDGRGIRSRSKVPLVTNMAKYLKEANKAGVIDKIEHALSAADENIHHHKQQVEEGGENHAVKKGAVSMLGQEAAVIRQ